MKKVIESGDNYEIWCDVEADENEYDFVHYIGPTGAVPVYRRYHLNNFLNKHFRVKTLYKGQEWDLAKNPKYGIIVSAPQGSEFLSEIDCPIFYDRTDYWNAHENEKYRVEDWLLEKARVITCSSKYLSEITPNGIRIDNGAQYYYTNKRKRNVAVYVGKEDNKIDLEICEKWRVEHPELRFVSFGRKIPKYKFFPLTSWNEMMDYISTCKVGLIPLKINDYCKGQFNLKYWDYKQAGLDVWTTIDYNYKDATLKYWDDVCRDILKAYGFDVEKSQNTILIHEPNDVVYAKWRTSFACNFKCPYCIQRNSKGKNLSREEMKEVAHQWARLIDTHLSTSDKRLKIGIIGGEPSLYPLDEYLKEWNDVALKYDKTISVSILTNFSLHDENWWNSLHLSNINLNLNTSLHPSQYKNDSEIEQQLDKAKKITANISIKLVCGNDNFEECKKYANMITSRGLKLLVDGEREPRKQDVIVTNDAYEWSIERGAKTCNLNGKQMSRTELINICHNLNLHDCHCWHRMYIDGDELISGCKLPTKEKINIRDIKKLEWVEDDCRLFGNCSYCNAGKLVNL